MNTQFQYELGKYAKDTITGFEGAITGRCQHITGCNTYGLTPKVDKDGKIRDGHWFDEGRIIIIEEEDKNITPESVQSEKNGAGENPKETRNNPA